MKQGRAAFFALMALVFVALVSTCSAPVLINGNRASLDLSIALDAAFAQAVPDGARFLLPEMNELYVSAQSLDPLVIADVRVRASVRWDTATSRASASATLYGLPVDTALRVVVEGYLSGTTAATRAEAELTIPAENPSASLSLVLQPTASFPIETISPSTMTGPIIIEPGRSMVFQFDTSTFVGSPAFFGWSYPQDSALKASLRLTDGTAVSLSPKADASGLDFTTPHSDLHYLILYNPESKPAKLGKTVVAISSFTSIPFLSVPSGITKQLGDAPFYLNPSSDSGGILSFSSGTTSVADIDSATGLVTIKTIGSATLSVSQGAFGFWDAPSTAFCVLTVSGTAPTIAPWSITAITYSPSLSFTLTQPSSNSTGSFSYTSDNPSVAYVSGSTVTVIGAGSAVITATQAPAGIYGGGSVSTTLVVNKGTPIIDSFPPLSMTMVETNKAIIPPVLNLDTPSTGLISYTIVSGSTVTIDPVSVTVSPITTGSTTIEATLAPDANWEGSSATTTVMVTLAPASISGLPATITKTFGDPVFDLTVVYPFTSPNSMPFGYSTSDGAVASSDGYGNVTIHGAGTCNILVSQTSDGVYADTSASSTIIVNKAMPIITGVSPAMSFPLSMGTNQLMPTSSGGGTPTYISTNMGVAKVDSTGKLTFVTPGTTQIHIQYPEMPNYQAFVFIIDLTITP